MMVMDAVVLRTILYDSQALQIPHWQIMPIIVFTFLLGPNAWFAYVVLRAQVAGSPELAAALQQFVRERLADYKRPRGIAFVAELPKTATGKLQRFKLRTAANG